MRVQDFIVDQTIHEYEEAFRYIRAVPADKLDWKPLETGRSVLDQARELAKTPDWAYSLVSGQSSEEWNDETAMAQQAEMNSWTTVDECYEAGKQRLEKLFELYRALPDERLSETKWLPYSGGRDFTMIEMLDYPRWNYNYHLGAIAYIQTLYGDKDMH